MAPGFFGGIQGLIGTVEQTLHCIGMPGVVDGLRDADANSQGKRPFLSIQAQSGDTGMNTFGKRQGFLVGSRDDAWI